MGFRIGGLLAAGALCVLVILQVANPSDQSHEAKVWFSKPPTRVHTSSEIVLCAKAKEPKLLKSVNFRPAKGYISPLFKYTGSESPSKKLLDGGVLTFEPKCRTYYVPNAVKGKEEVIPIYLVLKGNVEDTLHLKVFSGAP